MYKDHFSFSEVPFSIAPDPRYLYMSAGHREALAHLLYGVEGYGGFVLLTGEVGTGKTTVCRCLLEQMPPNCHVALILNPNLTVLELLSSICDEFRIPHASSTKSIKTFVDLINEFLLKAHASNEKTVLIIDEGQNLKPDVLEQMRLLTNLETNERKLLQIILIGQPELRLMLARPELRQVSQRIVARYHLGHLSKNEVEGYVRHRLSVAGGDKEIFDRRVLGLLHSLSNGIPRVINLLCDRALLGAYSQGLRQVNRKTLLQASREIFGEEEMASAKFPLSGTMKFVALLFFVAFGLTGILWGNTPWQTPAGNKHEVAVESIPQRKSMPVTALVSDDTQFTRPPQNVPPPQHAAQHQAPLTRVSIEDGFKSEHDAFESLFRLWGKSYDPDKSSNACAQAEAQGLLCHSGRGNLEELRRLNRPAILKLYDQEERSFHLILLALHKEMSQFIGGQKTFAVSNGVIADLWRGEFQLIWEPPPHYRRALRIGDTGPAVQWLREQMNLVDEMTFGHEDPKPYDQDLREAVRRFQIVRGLQPDGIAGPQTLIHLKSQLPGASPVLNAQWQEN